jgi:hypothetical protein
MRDRTAEHDGSDTAVGLASRIGNYPEVVSACMAFYGGSRCHR